MLRLLPCIGNASRESLCSLRRGLPISKKVQASISTNTAINKSLRRSQPGRGRTSRPSSYGERDDARRSRPSFPSERRGRFDCRQEVNPAQYDREPFRRFPPQRNHEEPRRPSPSHPSERPRRPNHRQGMDSSDVDQFQRINERYRELKWNRKQPLDSKPLRRLNAPRLRALAEESVDQGLTKEETFHRARPQRRDEKYNYEGKAGGNRATRRAAEFSHTISPAPGAGTSPRITQSVQVGARREDERFSFQRTRRSQGFRDESTPGDRNSETHVLSLPKDLRCESEGSAEPLKPYFTMGRQTTYQQGSLGSRTQGDYRTDAPQLDSHLARHDEASTPLSMPYTTPASEFLYGTSVVVSALHASRRKLYKLYIYDGDNRDTQNQDLRVRKLALERNVIVEKVKDGWVRLMDKMSGGRPHNGYILEASPLPKLPVTGFHRVEKRQAPFHVILDHQSREDQEINGRDTRIKYDATSSRFPFVLLLDGILDPGNLGAIMRTSFFLGVDVVAIGNRNSAPVSPVALKASSGASESIPLVSVNQPASFLETCKKNGWKLYAAVAPNPSKQSGSKSYLSTSNLNNPLRHHPCIMILGGEGDGLRWNIQRMADYDVGIEGRRIGEGGVDSLNVSVAAGLLCEAFIRQPVEAADVVEPDSFVRGSDTDNVLFSI